MRKQLTSLLDVFAERFFDTLNFYNIVSHIFDVRFEHFIQIFELHNAIGARRTALLK